MTNETVRAAWHDRFMEKTVLKGIPRKVVPNHLTILRFALTPFVLYFLANEDWRIAVPLFLLAALTDAIDGALARTRRQITFWGTLADPVADKLLIGSVVILFVAEEINTAFAAVILCMELIIVTRAVVRRLRHGEYIGANWAGKVKMFLQCTGVSVLLLAQWSGVNLFVPVSIGTLSLAILFAVFSLSQEGL